MNNFEKQFFDIFTNKNVIGLFSSTISILLLGVFLGKKEILDRKASGYLSNIILNISIPALSLVAFIKDFDSELFKNGISLFVWGLLLNIFFIFVTKFFYIKKTLRERKAYEILTIFGGITILGIPVFEALFGDLGLIYVSIFSSVYRVFLYTYGFLVMSDSKLTRCNMKNIFLSPIFLSTFIGLLIWTTQGVTPQLDINGEYYGIFRIDKTAFFIYKPLTYLASLTSPLAWLAAGLKISEVSFKDAIKNVDALYFTLIKIVLFPIISLFLIKLGNLVGFFPLNIIPATVLVVSMGTPVASVTLAYCIKYDKISNVASSASLISTVAFLIFLPIILLLLNFI